MEVVGPSARMRPLTVWLARYSGRPRSTEGWLQPGCPPESVTTAPVVMVSAMMAPMIAVFMTFLLRSSVLPTS